jgi:putative addiction module component (TIGR02574 family)
MELAEIEAEAMKLDPNARVELVRSLAESLESEGAPLLERLWLDEVERRQSELDTGQVELIPGDQVLARSRSSQRR